MHMVVMTSNSNKVWKEITAEETLEEEVAGEGVGDE